MNAIYLSLLAAVSASGANLCFRKSMDSQPSPAAYMLFFYLASFLGAFALNPVLLSQPWNLKVGGLGGLAGFLNVGLMLLTAKALLSGPAGLTYAFQNASSIFPNLLLALIFGASFGFTVTYPQTIGMLCVLGGLFLAAKQPSGEQSRSTQWFFYAVGAFLVQVIILSLFQWRCLLFSCPAESHILIPFNYLDIEDAVFMPGFFAVALAFQAILFFKNRQSVSLKEWGYGSLGGLANGMATYFLLMATKLAEPSEKAVIFPLFAVSVIVLCSLWGHVLYGERLDWKSLLLCIAGILIASLLP